MFLVLAFDFLEIPESIVTLQIHNKNVIKAGGGEGRRSTSLEVSWVLSCVQFVNILISDTMGSLSHGRGTMGVKLLEGPLMGQP